MRVRSSDNRPPPVTAATSAREDRLGSLGHLRFRAMSTKSADHHDRHDQGPLDHLAEIGIDIEENQIGRYQGQHERGDHRPDHSAASAGQADPADDHRGQSAERVVDACERRPDSRGHRQAEAADRTEQTGEYVCGKARAVDIDAAAEGRYAIAADRIELKPKLGSAQGDPDHGDRRHEQDQRIGQPGCEQRSRAEIEEFLRGAAAGLLEDDKRDAAPDESRRQGRHHVGNTRQHDDQAVQRADRGAGHREPSPPAARIDRSSPSPWCWPPTRWRPP